MIESGRYLTADFFHHVFAGGKIIHSNSGSHSITDYGVIPNGDLIAALGIDRVALRHVSLVSDQGIAGKVVGGTGLVAADNTDGVGLYVAQVRNLGLFTGSIGSVGTHVKHGSVGPVAIVAQHRDGMGGTQITLSGGNGRSIYKAFHKSAGLVVLVQHGLLLFGENNRHIHNHSAVGRQIDNRVLGGEHRQQIMHVVGIGIAVKVYVGIFLVCLQCYAGNNIIHQKLRISLVGLAVAVEVELGQVAGRIHILTVHIENYIRIQIAGPGILIQGHGVVPGIGVVLEQTLGEQVGVQIVIRSLIGEVGEGKAEVVDAFTLRVVAKLSLYLAVVLAVYQNEGLGGSRGAGVCQTGALAEDGNITGFAVLILKNGLCGGHHQRLCQRAVREIFLRQIVFFNVLLHQCSDTRNLRRSHGGTGHALILVGAAHHTTAGLVGTVQGVDHAAGGGDFRLHGQIAGNTPGAEITHGEKLGALVQSSLAADNGQLAGVVLETGFGGLLGSDCLHSSAFRLCDGNAGGSVLVIRQIHADGTGLIVVNDGSGSAQIGSVIALFKEADFAAGAKDNLAGEVDVRVISRRANAIGQHEIVLRTSEVSGGIQTSQGAVLVTGGFVVNDAGLASLDVGAECAVVVNGSNAQGVGVSTGRAAGMPCDILCVHIAGRVGRRIVRPSAAVAGGNGYDGIGLAEGIQNVLIFLKIGITGVAGTQRQVHRIGAQQNRVFDGNHIVGIVSAALVAEHLHHKNLRVGRVTYNANLAGRAHILVALFQVTVGGRNTGNVRAVLSLGVVQVGHIQVVIHIAETESDLFVSVQIFRSNGAVLFISVQLFQNRSDFRSVQQILLGNILVIGHTGGLGVFSQRVLERIVVERLMIGVQAGIDDGDTGTCAGVAGLPGSVCAGHLGRNRHVGLIAAYGVDSRLITSFHDDFRNAGNLFDLSDLAELYVGGDHIRSQSHVPDHIQLLAGGLGNGLFYALLVRLQIRTVRHSSLIIGDAGGCVARSDGGSVLQHDGDTNGVSVCIERFFLGFLQLFLIGKLCRNRAVVYFGEVDAVLITGSGSGNCQTAQQRYHEHHGKQTIQVLLIHFCFSFSKYISNISLQAEY